MPNLRISLCKIISIIPVCLMLSAHIKSNIYRTFAESRAHTGIHFLQKKVDYIMYTFVEESKYFLSTRKDICNSKEYGEAMSVLQSD